MICPALAPVARILDALVLAAPARASLIERVWASVRGHPLEYGTAAAALVALGALLWVGILRPGGLDTKKRDVSGHPAWMWLACAVMAYSGAVIGGSLAAQLPGVAEDLKSERSLAIVSLASGLGGVVASWVVARLVAGAGAAASGVTPRWSDLPRGVLCFALGAPIVQGVSLVTGVVYLWINHAEAPHAAHPLLKELQDSPRDAWVWAKLGGAVVLAPLMEEFIYRGFVQTGLLRLTGRAWVSVWLTAAAFAGMHVIGPAGSRVDWTSVPTLLVLGAAMGAAYERTGRIGVPMTMHALFNAGNVAVMWLTMKNP